MFIINPLPGARMDNLFSHHPAPENRIAALQEMANSTGGYTAPAPRPSRPTEPGAGPWGGSNAKPGGQTQAVPGAAAGLGAPVPGGEGGAWPVPPCLKAVHARAPPRLSDYNGYIVHTPPSEPAAVIASGHVDSDQINVGPVHRVGR